MEEESNISNYYYVIRKNFFLIAALFLIIFGAFAYYSYRSEPAYTASSMVSVAGANLYGLQPSSQKPDASTQVQIIKSSKVAQQVFLSSDAGFSYDAVPVKSSNLIEITAESRDPFTAQSAANLIAESYINYTYTTRLENMKGSIALLDRQINETQDELSRLNSNLLLLQESHKRTVDEELEYQKLQQEVRLMEDDREYFLSKIQKSMDVLETPGYTDLSRQRVLEEEKNHAPEIIRVSSAHVNSTEAMLDSVNRRILELDQKKKLTPDEELQQIMLTQEIGLKNKRYSELLAMRSDMGMTSGGELPEGQIIQYASLPSEPVKPNMPLNIALGMILGLVSSVGIAFMKEYARNTYINIQDIEDDFGHNVIGTLPKASKSRKEGMQGHYLYLTKRPNDMFSEYLRMIRTNLMFIAGEKKIKLISVTSAQKNDGKSTVVINLALSLAKNDIKVLLVDANMRNPIMNRIFRSKDNEPGLSDAIMGSMQPEDIIMQTDYNNLHVIYAGQQIVFPSELVCSKKMAQICGQLKKMQYDIILFDNTSLEFSESSLMAANSEGVLYVIRFDKTNRSLALKGKNALENVKANIMGVVINYFK